jgi:hypothetical protein
MTVYLVRVSITGLVGVTVVISGELHSVLTITGTSTAGPNSTVQVRLGEDPAIIVPTGGVTVTVVGAGTEESIEWRLIKIYMTTRITYE